MSSSEQAVIVTLTSANMPAAAWRELETLEEACMSHLQLTGAGEFDGHEIGATDVRLFFYGHDANHLFVSLEPILRREPLCADAHVLVRPGPPDSAGRSFRLS